MQAIIKTEKLVKSFGKGDSQQIIIDNLDLEIYENDFTIIMGSSGAGKSTLMYAISGMDKVDSGVITFNGVDIARLNDAQMATFRRINCGFVFQQIYLLDKMSLLDNVLTAGLLVNKNKNEVLARAKELFAKVNLDAKTYQKNVKQISGGEAQRAGIVRAAINNPKLIFADEPTGALNSHNSAAVLDVFSALNEAGQSIVMVTHDKKSALRGNRIIYLKDGKIVGDLRLPKYQPDDAARTRKLEQFLREMGW